MITIDRRKFFDGYRGRFGPLTNDLVDALEILLAQVEADSGFTGTDADRRQLAYCLATFKWETAHTMRPIDEHGTAKRFNSLYGPQTKVGKVLGNTKPGDGALFHGRGYVQLTGRRNYAKAKALTGVDLVAEPDRAKVPEVAYTVAMEGMRQGWFTGRKLSQFIRDGHLADFENARTIINGHDKAGLIADIARRFSEVLLESMKTSA